MRLLSILSVFAVAAAAGQNAPAAAQQAAPASDTVHQSDAVFRVDVVGRTAKAVNYQHRSGATKIDFLGTALAASARGEAKVASKQGRIEIDAKFEGLQPATTFGPEYLTYVLWAITADGRPTNLGEVLLKGGKSSLNVTTELQQFALIVTAEPYYAVRMPSDVVVMDNEVRPDTRGTVDEVIAKFELLQRGQYTRYTDTARLSALRGGPKTPLEILEARNAMMIAESLQAPAMINPASLHGAMTARHGFGMQRTGRLPYPSP